MYMQQMICLMYSIAFYDKRQAFSRIYSVLLNSREEKLRYFMPLDDNMLSARLSLCGSCREKSVFFTRIAPVECSLR